MTLPNLNSSTGEKEKVAKVKKIYRDLNDALGRAEAVYGPIEEWKLSDSNDNRRFLERLTEFMKVSKSDFSNNTVVLADGSAIVAIWNLYYNDREHYYPNSTYMGDITVDIDGPNKGKNQYGIDIFVFDITKENGILPEGIDNTNGKNACFKNGINLYCTRWIIENENMDYLKCYDDLKWGQKTSCK